MRLLSLLNGELFASKKLNLEPPVSLVVSASQVSITQSWHTLVASSGNPNSRVGTINGGTIGDLLVIQRDPSSTANPIIEDNVGNLSTAGNFTLNSDADVVVLLCTSSGWIELVRSNN